MNSSRPNALLAFAVVLVLAAGLWFAHGRVHFDWGNLGRQMRAVDWRYIAAGVAAIYLSATLRAARWRVLLGRVGEGRWWHLIAAQFIGFTAVALFGRVVDLARPYLIARRTRTTVAAQLAVYSIERALDLGAAAALFSLTLLFTPRDMPHHEAFVRAGVLSFAATLLLAAIALAIRSAGERLAGLCKRWLCFISAEFAGGIAEKILDFRSGLLAVETGLQIAVACFWSLALWALIAFSYWATAHAFRNTPELAGFTIPATMLLMATSMGGSLFQLPILGWFTQIGVLGGALHLFFDVPLEAASACGALMLLVTNLAMVPAGLIMARVTGVGLRDVADSSEVSA